MLVELRLWDWVQRYDLEYGSVTLTLRNGHTMVIEPVFADRITIRTSRAMAIEPQELNIVRVRV